MEWLKGAIQKVLGTPGSPAAPAATPSPPPAAIPAKNEVGADVSAYLDEAEPLLQNTWERFDPKTSETGRRILGSSPEMQSQFVTALTIQLTANDRDPDNVFGVGPQHRQRKAALALLQALLARKLPVQEGQVATLLEWIDRGRGVLSYHYPVSGVIRLGEQFVAENRMTESLVSSFAALRKKMGGNSGSETRRLCHRMDAIIGRTRSPLLPGEAWSDAALACLATADATAKTFWNDVLTHCATGTSATPTQKWLKQAEELLKDEAMRAEFVQRVTEWLPLVDKQRTATPKPGANAEIERWQIAEPHQDLLRGLAFFCGLIPNPDTARLLTPLALTSYKKLPGVGPRASRIGNACITALALMGTTEALGQLAVLKVRSKLATSQSLIDKAFHKLAEKLGVSRDDVEEMSVPSYGLTEPGRLIQSIGEFSAELRIISSRAVELIWRRSDGKEQKSLPAAAKAEHAESVKELMAAKKDIEKMLPAQSERLDNLYLQRKSWPLAVWRERYQDHPLVGALARRLIWNFTSHGLTAPGIWLNEQLVNRNGHALDLRDDHTTVTLWHPLNQSPDVVLGWRGFLEEWEIVQPFKQAHREVYLLTPAEEQTRVYSNRFAAHLLRQHQFNSLCAARGWKNKLRLMVDDCYPPATRNLAPWGLRAEYWIEGAGTEYGTDTLESGAYRYVATDQVRFYPENAAQLSAHAGGGGYNAGWGRQPVADPLPLADIDPLLFSEVMRDVDLFVGVASVGNDPNWLDGGRNEQQQGYWHEYSFGTLNASAQTRKAILERLVPRLKIAPQCSFQDKFLVVEGKLKSYKIHLGSGNILISPQDKYLCIVPAQAQVDKAGDKLFLPFEGDRVLSVILSKAFLLAADDKITDATILRQIR